MKFKLHLTFYTGQGQVSFIYCKPKGASNTHNGRVEDGKAQTSHPMTIWDMVSLACVMACQPNVCRTYFLLAPCHRMLRRLGGEHTCSTFWILWLYLEDLCCLYIAAFGMIARSISETTSHPKRYPVLDSKATGFNVQAGLCTDSC